MKSKSQTALDFNHFISNIEDLYTEQEHRTSWTLLRSVSHQYLKIPYAVRAKNFAMGRPGVADCRIRPEIMLL